jgi:hypothetical protein
LSPSTVKDSTAVITVLISCCICVLKLFEGSFKRPDEIKAFTEGSDSERATAFAKQGIDLAFFVDGVIQKYGLLEKEGCGVAFLAWSIGNAFLLSLLASITSLPVDIKRRLGAYVKAIILFGSFLVFVFVGAFWLTQFLVPALHRTTLDCSRLSESSEGLHPT